MVERHRKAHWTLEEESDCEISEAVADLYKVTYIFHRTPIPVDLNLGYMYPEVYLPGSIGVL